MSKNNTVIIKGTTVPRDIDHKIHEEQSKTKTAKDYCKCAIKKNMLTEHRKHAEERYKATKLDYYKQVISKINAVDMKDLSKLFNSIYI